MTFDQLNLNKPLLNALDDLLVEGDQDVEVTVDALADDFDGQVTVSNGTTAETITIVDTDTASVTMTVSTPVNEGDAATVTLTLNTAAGVTLEKNLVVDLTAVGTTALPADFSFPTTSVTFLAGSGDTDTQTLSLNALDDASQCARTLTRTTSHDLTADYAITLRLWRERLEATWPASAGEGFDERFRRLWRFYLAYCEGGFAERAIQVGQHLYARPGWQR